MKRLTLCLMLVLTHSAAMTQQQNVRDKLQRFFFNLPFEVDIETLRSQLKQNPSFKFYDDPNRDGTKSITGTFTQYEKMDTSISGNQFIVLYSSAKSKKRQHVSLKWSVNYELEDLPKALFEFEKIKSDFKPQFADILEKEVTGQHGEQIISVILKMDVLSVTIRLIKYNNFIHTISVEYQDTWKVREVKSDPR